MQFFELLFLLVFAASTIRLVTGPMHPRLSYWNMAVAALVVVTLGFIFEGWRWQMLPAYLGFGLLLVGALKKSETKPIWRGLGALPLLVLLGVSIFLTIQLPVFALPAPAGPYGVGTFDYSITDESRVERFAPESNRELYVEVWYPADKGLAASYPPRTLYQEIYEGSYDIWGFLLGYLRHVPTHSHVEAPVVEETGPFPVLIFNHGSLSFTSQNQLLMEHLASQGYVIFSIAHPYQSVKVNLEIGGTVGNSDIVPSDIQLPLEQMERNLLSKIRDAGDLSILETSDMRAILLGLADGYAAAENTVAKAAFLAAAVELQELQPYAELMTEQSLGEYLLYTRTYQSRQVEYWVEDIQFVVTTIPDIKAPFDGFLKIVDIEKLGVFGMSFGGAAAGEFCKIDARCRAGSNLDGTQFGLHWDTKLPVPFLMFYHEVHQGGNDYAYLPPSQDFWDYTVLGTTHFNFMELAHTLPVLKTIGLTGPIDAMRMIDIVNSVQLSFFDQYLKGIPVPPQLQSGLPEVVVRQY